MAMRSSSFLLNSTKAGFYLWEEQVGSRKQRPPDIVALLLHLGWPCNSPSAHWMLLASSEGAKWRSPAALSNSYLAMSGRSWGKAPAMSHWERNCWCLQFPPLSLLRNLVLMYFQHIQGTKMGTEAGAGPGQTTPEIIPNLNMKEFCDCPHLTEGRKEGVNASCKENREVGVLK